MSGDFAPTPSQVPATTSPAGSRNGLRVRRAPGAAARQLTERVHHQGAAQRPAACFWFAAGAQDAADVSAAAAFRQQDSPAATAGPAAARPAGACAVPDHSGRRPSGQRVAAALGPMLTWMTPQLAAKAAAADAAAPGPPLSATPIRPSRRTRAAVRPAEEVGKKTRPGRPGLRAAEEGDSNS